jgi:catechol 2,3-dioxygenase-like lactoylglutathione lyase family enzyme
MINKVGGIMVFVSDQGQSVKFYTEKLGFDILVNMPYRGGK